VDGAILQKVSTRLVGLPNNSVKKLKINYTRKKVQKESPGNKID